MTTKNYSSISTSKILIAASLILVPEKKKQYVTPNLTGFKNLSGL
ncbi:hypothetical protein [Flavobacterium sp.]